MAKVFNWQLGREMEYPYEDARPKKQVAWVFDTNKCIACQTCSIACKTTWSSGRGQEYMFWKFTVRALGIQRFEKIGRSATVNLAYACII